MHFGALCASLLESAGLDAEGEEVLLQDVHTARLSQASCAGRVGLRGVQGKDVGRGDLEDGGRGPQGGAGLGRHQVIQITR